MALKKIYFDESGYTGPALLDPDQPYFCIASSDIENEQASEILAQSFPRYQGEEVKFQRLWRRHAHRRGLLQFATELGRLQPNIFVWGINKKFCVLTKFVDFLIEPFFHSRGYDFYANGFGMRFANCFHFQLLHIGSVELYESVISLYYEFSRSPNPDGLASMQYTLRLMSESVSDELRDYFMYALEVAMNFERFYDLSTFSDTNETQLTSVLGCVGYWRQHSVDDFELFHDNSSNFFSQAEVWRAITSDDVTPQMHPLACGGAVEFPLRVLRTVSCDSKDHKAIQFCDLVAGLCAKSKSIELDDEASAFVAELLEVGLGQVNSNGIRPELQFPEGPPVVAQGPDSVDAMTEIMRTGRIEPN